MPIEEIFGGIWIPAALGLVCTIYGIYMLITKDPSRIRRKGDTAVLKDAEKYAVTGGWLMLFMALGCLIMMIIIEFVKSEMIATIESMTWFLIFAIMWKRMNDKYGAL